MALQGPKGDEFGLRIAGYQFPHIQDEEYDANWLVMEIVATARRRSWQARDPCLLTWELAGPLDWLEAIAAGRSSRRALHFIEPNLRSGLAGTGTGRIRLEVCFALEWKPDGAKPPGVGELCAEAECGPDELRAWVAGLREQLGRYRPRAGVRIEEDRPAGDAGRTSRGGSHG